LERSCWPRVPKLCSQAERVRHLSRDRFDRGAALELVDLGLRAIDEEIAALEQSNDGPLTARQRAEIEPTNQAS
jgi:hypothetical protein